MRNRAALLALSLPGLLIGRAGAAGAPPLIDLAGRWAFRTDPQDSGGKKGWAKPEFDDAQWRRITVPGTWESQGITQRYEGMPSPVLPAKHRAAGLANAYNGVAWYRRWIEIPAAWRGQGVELLIGGVDDVDRTYLDGREIGRTGEGAEHPSLLVRRYALPKALAGPGRHLLAVRVFDGGGPGGIHGGPVVLVAREALKRMAEKQAARKAGADPAEQFASPPNDRRILQIVHHLPKDPARHETFLLALLCQGFGGMVTNVRFDGYLRSEENWRSFAHCVRLAGKLGMALWLYDEKGYPSGTAGGQTLQGHPEWEAMGLLAVDVPAGKGVASVELPAGGVLLARACPVRRGVLDLAAAVDLSKTVSKGRLRWKVPAGTWRIVAFVQQPLYEGTHATYNLSEARRYVNLLMPGPTARFLELTHQRYADRLPELGKLFEATFTDEPSLMSVFGRAGRSHPPIPWSPGFREAFRKRKGYDLVPLLPALIADVGPKTGKVRCDFRQTVAALVAENFFGRIRDWCRKHRVLSGGHLLAEEDILAHCGYYGDFFACARRLDAPSMDCLTSLPPAVPWHVAKMIGSIAALEGRGVTMCETSDFSQRYRPPGDERKRQQVRIEEVRGTLNRLYVGGVNTITSYYRWQDLALTTRQLKALNEYAGRAGTMLAGGRLVSDVAVYYPIESVWAHYVPSRQGLSRRGTALRIAKTFRQVGACLFKGRRDFCYVDAAALRGAAVAGRSLRVGTLAFRVLILPQVDTIGPDVRRTVAEFHAAGGIVIAVGAVPANSTEAFPCSRTRALSKRIFGAPAADGLTCRRGAAGGLGIHLPASHARLLPHVLDRVIEPDFAAQDPRSPLRYTHRRLGERDVYFVINDSPRPAAGGVSLCAEGPAEVWDPLTGKRGAFVAAGPLKLGAYAGTFIVCGKCRPRRLRPASFRRALRIDSTPIGEAIQAPLTFTAGGGAKHVTTTVTATQPGTFRSEAVIRLGGKDSWSFPRARFARPVDLSGFAGLAFRSRVPSGQDPCGAELMVILIDAGGGTYLAHTGRALGEAGARSSTVWFDDFRALGKSTDAGRPLDLGKIAALAIGWGGYFGTAKEKIAYTITDVRLLSLPAAPQ